MKKAKRLKYLPEPTEIMGTLNYGLDSDIKKDGMHLQSSIRV